MSDGTTSPATGLMIYHGELSGLASPGISWSADQAVAVDYARRSSTAGPTRVLRAMAPPSAVLARFADEDEVVVQPGLLMHIACITDFPHFTLPNLASGLRFRAFGWPLARPRCELADLPAGEMT